MSPAKAKTKREVVCTLCGARRPADRESRSWFMHGHPSACPARQDRVPVMNGVHLGDLWRGHGGIIRRVVDLRLGGEGTYTDREAVVVLVEVWSPPAEAPEGQLDLGVGIVEPTVDELEQMEPADDAWVFSDPLWALVEHADPVTRPGEYPVPFTENSDRGYPERWAAEEWRGPGYRRIPQDPDDPNPPVKDWEEREHAYWHSRFVVQGHAIRWHGDGWMEEVKSDA